MNDLALTSDTACALLVNDDERLCIIARWFMTQYQFVADGYRLYSALHRLCDSKSGTFNYGPSQKFILRQLKAMDLSYQSYQRAQKMQVGNPQSEEDGEGNNDLASKLNVTLLMLYGHILYAGRSYAYAISEFL